ncbi:hypothetical protein [Nonomuraea basaltis]|uniref:hypothetical protein n=1 Tax=Nonomuraea basaltis TaxID=2495887 RepID=UPI00110C560E|nr:hypothetical protein [Nonomuraea basaltis]TMR92396.1 hypothetical protein EJK15_44730 [Nonomuraea basaltis]
MNQDPQRETRLRRDLIALVLIVAGIGGTLAVAWSFNPLLFWLGLSVSAFVGGVLLGSGK